MTQKYAKCRYFHPKGKKEFQVKYPKYVCLKDRSLRS